MAERWWNEEEVLAYIAQRAAWERALKEVEDYANDYVNDEEES